jgi:quercetin dioxygenase-like cupin family protein
MNTNLSHLASERIVSLHAEQIRRLHGAAHLRVTDGTVWLTVTGQPDDHLLRPGDRFTLERGSNALIESIADRACVAVAEPASSWMQRAAATLQGVTQRLAAVLA